MTEQTSAKSRLVDQFLQFSSHLGDFRDIREQDVLEVLTENGVSDLETLIRRALEVRHAEGSPARPPANVAAAARMLAQPTNTATEQQVVHTVPKVPVIIDGVEYDPGDITRLNGQALHFMVDLSVPESPVLVALTDDQPLRTALCTASLVSSTRGDREILPSSRIAGANVKMYEHGGFSGDWFWLDAGFNWPDLTRVFHGPFFDRRDWNDQISSTVVTGGLVEFFDHIHLGGDRLSVQGDSTIGTGLPDLGLFGWNDRISSVIHWG